MEIVVERALVHLPPGTPTPRLISDSGARYVSRQFKSYLRERDASHSRSRPHHPQSNGKMERFHPLAKTGGYRAQRLHSALHYLTPADYLRGLEHVQQRLTARRTALAEAARRRRAYWKAVEEDGSA